MERIIYRGFEIKVESVEAGYKVYSVIKEGNLVSAYGSENLVLSAIDTFKKTGEWPTCF